MSASYVDPRSGVTYPLDVPRWRSDDGGPLLLTPGAGIGRDDIERNDRSLWRYRAALAGDISRPISMGEGATPLVERPWGTLRPRFKCEWFSPTGSFKDRGASVMLSFLRGTGVTAVLEDSSGNGGSAIAGYGAAADMRVKVLAPASTSPAKIAQARAYGAEVELVEGPREATQAEAIRQSTQTFYASHNWQPFFLEGVKTLAYEIWEDFGFRAPDNIVVPVGAGSLLLGLHFGFGELRRARQIERLPRLFAAQPAHCAPVFASFQAGVDTVVPCEFHATIAEGTSIRAPLRLKQMIAALRESGGAAIAVSEDDIVAAWRRLAASGLFVEPTSATAAAALTWLGAAGAIASGDDTVVVLSGFGLKTGGAVSQLLGR